MGEQLPLAALAEGPLADVSNEFARQRADNIARNRAKMQALGLLSISGPAILQVSQQPPAAPAKRRKTTATEVALTSCTLTADVQPVSVSSGMISGQACRTAQPRACLGVYKGQAPLLSAANRSAALASLSL